MSECIYNQHHRVGTGEARWHLIYTNPKACGCDTSELPARVLCDGCLRYWTTSTTQVCLMCRQHVIDVWASIESIERLP